MALRKQFAYQSRYFVQALQTLALPEWFSSSVFRLGLVGLLGLTTLLYVVQLSKASVSGYKIHALESKVESLVREQEKIDVAIIENSSLSSITKRMEKLTMVKAGKLLKLVPAQTDVAVATKR